MARIVMGVAASHSPQVSSPTDVWQSQAEVDQGRGQMVGPGGRVGSYLELAAAAPDSMISELRQEVWDAKYERIQRSVRELARVTAEVNPDVLVIVGDDQEEMLLPDDNPVVAIYTGSSIEDIPAEPDEVARLGAMSVAAQWARHAEQAESYPVVTELAQHLVRQLQPYGVVELTSQPAGRSIGHAFTFVRLRLTPDVAPKPMVAVFLNCLYGESRPSAPDCVALGQDLAAAIEGWDSELTVALVASGGLSHFVVDEELDRRVLRGLADSDLTVLSQIEGERLESGNGEIRNWLVLGGALHGRDMTLVDYIPAYRSPAGTGVGMAFVHWT